MTGSSAVPPIPDAVTVAASTGAHPGAAPRLRLGTRGSALALAQSGTIADALIRLGASVEIVTIRTAGDIRAPDTIWGEGAFVTALEAALLDDRIDVAVHSAKDVPTTLDERLRIAAFPPREDPRDALVTVDPGLTLDTLPIGARVGTDSPRRVAFLLARRPDLRPFPLHGNVDTRLRRLGEGESDALVLAVAGLTRLGLASRITEAIPADVVPPAPGQGALAVQCRADDAITGSLVERLDDPATRTAVLAERAFLAASGGGCRAPLGALATIRDGILELLVGAADPADVRVGDAPEAAAVAAPGTTFTARQPSATRVRVAWASASASVQDASALARALADRITATIDRRAVAGGAVAGGAATGGVARGHKQNVRPARPAGTVPRPSARPRVLVTRETKRGGPLVEALRDRGLDPVHVPTIAVEQARPGGPLDAAAAAMASHDWVVVTSANGAEALAAAAARHGVDLAAARIASVGAATSAAVARGGGVATFTPNVARAAALADELPITPGAQVLLIRGQLADARLAGRLRGRGAVVHEVLAYRTIEGPVSSATALRDAVRSGLAGLVFTSGSTVRGLLALLEAADRPAILDLPAFCIGPSTASVARGAGFARVHEAPSPDTAALANVVRSGLAAGSLLPASATQETS